MMEAYNEIILFFTINTTTSDRASTPKNIINTQETDKKNYFVHADITRSGKETKIHDNINKNIKSNDKTMDNGPEAISYKKCEFETKKIKKSKAQQRMRAHVNKHHREVSTGLDHLEDVLEYGTETATVNTDSTAAGPDGGILVGDTEPEPGIMSSSDKHNREVSTELVSATPEILAGNGPEDCILETLACNKSAQCFSSLQFDEISQVTADSSVTPDIDAINKTDTGNSTAVGPDGCIHVGDTEP